MVEHDMCNLEWDHGIITQNMLSTRRTTASLQVKFARLILTKTDTIQKPELELRNQQEVAQSPKHSHQLI